MTAITLTKLLRSAEDFWTKGDFEGLGSAFRYLQYHEKYLGGETDWSKTFMKQKLDRDYPHVSAEMARTTRPPSSTLLTPG